MDRPWSLRRALDLWFERYGTVQDATGSAAGTSLAQGPDAATPEP